MGKMERILPTIYVALVIYCCVLSLRRHYPDQVQRVHLTMSQAFATP